MPELISNTLPAIQDCAPKFSGSHVIENAVAMLTRQGRLLRQLAWELEIDMPHTKTIQAANKLIFDTAKKIDEINTSRTPLPKLCIDVDNDQTIVLEWFLAAGTINFYIDDEDEDTYIIITDQAPWLEHSELQVLDLTSKTLAQAIKFAIYASQTNTRSYM